MKKLAFILFSIFLLSNGLSAQTAKKFKKQADTYLKEKNYLGAIEEYTKVNDLEPNNYDALFNRGLCFESIREHQKAIDDFLACNKLDLKDKEVYLKIGSLYMTLNNYESAIKTFDQLLVIDKGNIEALQKSASCHLKLNQYDLAIIKADIAITEEPRADGKTSEISHYYRAIAKDSLKDYVAAIQSYKKAITTFKNQARAKTFYKPYYINLASVLYKTKQYDESIENYDIAIINDERDTVLPKNYVAHYLRSFPYLGKADYKAAFNDLNKAVYLEPKDGILFYQRGIVLMKTFQYNSALSDFTKALLLNEKIALAHLFKAQCLLELGNYKEAIVESKIYLKLSPNHIQALALLKEAEEKHYNANRESDPPIIKWYYPFVDQNNFINVYNNQVNAVLEGEVGDKSLIKSMSVNGRNLPFNTEETNPQFKFKIPTDNLKKIDLVVTDIYNNVSTKTVKVGKIVSDTRLIVNMEGFILSDDENKAPLANKNIYITNQKGEQFFATTTDEKGRFQFKNLPFDKDYLIEVEGSEELALQNKKFIVADKSGKPVLKSNANGKNKFNFEILQTDFVALSLMEMDDVSLAINLSGRVYALMPEQTPINNLMLQLIKPTGEVIMKKTDANGYFIFLNVNPSDSYSFKIDETEAKNINSTTIVIANSSGQIIKTIQKNQYGFFEYKLLDAEKIQMASVSEPDPWMKIITLSAEKKQLEIIENIYYESGSATLPKAGEELLMKAVAALKSNPKLTLEIESHTDAVASDDFNLFLSQKRASTVTEFITKNGIDSKRLISKGLGETLIVNHCVNGIDCSDGEHKQNRRTVFKLNYN